MRPVHQVDGHVAGEPRRVKVEGRDKSQATAGNGPEPHARRDTRVAQIELPADGEPQQRNATVRRQARSRLTTTVLTMTLTGLAADSRTRALASRPSAVRRSSDEPAATRAPGLAAAQVCRDFQRVAVS